MPTEPHSVGFDPQKPKVMRMVRMKKISAGGDGSLPRLDTLRNTSTPVGALRAIRGVPR